MKTLGVEDPAAVEKVTALADSYADQIVVSLRTAHSEEELRRGLAGAFINFLVDALSLAESPV